MRYKIRSYADDPRLFWVVDTETGAPTTQTPLTRNEALLERERREHTAAVEYAVSGEKGTTETTTIGTLEDVGKSVLICDNDKCEAMFSKLSGRYHDGDACPTCRDGQDEPDVLAAANRYGIR